MGTLRLKRGTKTALQTNPGFTPAEGELVYTTDSKEVFVGDGATQGGVPVSVSTQNLEDLGNVQALAAQKDQILVYNGSNWAATENPALDVRGNIYGDDSTLLVDAINGKIVGPVETTTVTATTLTGNLVGDSQGSHTGSVVGNVVGNLVGSVTGDLTGTVTFASGGGGGGIFGDDSTVILDGTTRALTVNSIKNLNNLSIESSGSIDVANNGALSLGANDSSGTFQNGQLLVKRSGTAGIAFAISTYQDGDNISDIKAVKHRGTITAPTSYQAGDRIMELVGQAFDGTANRESVFLRFQTTAAVSNNVAPGKSTLFVANADGSFKSFISENDGTFTADNLKSNAGFVQFGSMTTTQRDALTAANGMVIYNSSDNKFQGYENGAWVNLV